MVTQGDGWYAYDLSPEDLERRLDTLRLKMQRQNRSDSEVEVIVGPNRHPVNEQTTAQYESLGVAQLVVPLFGTTLEKIEERALRFLN